MGGFNGSGQYLRYYNWVQDAANNIDITASRVDTEDTGFANGLSNVICRDGQTTILANLPMSGYAHTGVAAGTARNQYTQIGQYQDGGVLLLGSVTGGASNVLIASTAPAIPAYVTGQVFYGIPDANNTGDTTINIQGQGAIHILKNGATLGANDLQADVPFSVMVVTGSPTVAALLSPATTPFVPSYSLQPNTIKTVQTSLASATTTDLGTIPSQNVLITGTTTITSFGSSANVNSPIYLLEFNNILTLTYNVTSMILPGGASLTTAAGDTAVVEDLGSGNWKIRGYNRASGKAATGSPPTFQYLTSGSTYNTPVNAIALSIKAWGAGGGGGAGNTNAGVSGGNTIFNSVNAAGGSGGPAGTTSQVSGGAGGTGGSGTAAMRWPGGSGGGSYTSTAVGGFGGGTALSGSVGSSASGLAGASASNNTGCGGQGSSHTGSNNGAGGGGAGEYFELYIPSPSSTYSYTIGAGGTGGTAGGLAGGAGGSGMIIVTEYY